MNWTVRGVVKMTEQRVSSADEVCEHLHIGDTAHVVGEQDSFGPVTRFYYCSECYEVARQREGEELEYCHDCGCEKPRSEVLAWRWYDFYAPQGDEPIMVCSDCRKKPKHLRRVAKDRADREWEFGSVSSSSVEYDY